VSPLAPGLISRLEYEESQRAYGRSDCPCPLCREHRQAFTYGPSPDHLHCFIHNLTRPCPNCLEERNEAPVGDPVYLANDAAAPVGWIRLRTEYPYFNFAVRPPLSAYPADPNEAIDAQSTFRIVTVRQLRPLPGLVIWAVEERDLGALLEMGREFRPNTDNARVRRVLDAIYARGIYEPDRRRVPGHPTQPSPRSVARPFASSQLRPIEEWAEEASTVIAEHRAKWLDKGNLLDAREGPAPVPQAADNEIAEVRGERGSALAAPPSFLPALRG